MSDAPFAVGQRVRMTADARERVFPRNKSYTGTVISVRARYGEWYVRLRRRGYRQPQTFHARFWEAAP